MLWMRSTRSFSAWLPKGSTTSARSFVSGLPRCATASPVGKRQAGSIGRVLAENQNSGLRELLSAAAVISGVPKSGAHRIWVSGVCGNVNLDMLVDTGASTSFVSENYWRSMQNMPELSPMNNRVLCADGNDTIISIIRSLRREYEMQHPTSYINPMAENTLEILQQTTLRKLILEATEQNWWHHPVIGLLPAW